MNEAAASAAHEARVPDVVALLKDFDALETSDQIAVLRQIDQQLRVQLERPKGRP